MFRSLSFVTVRQQHHQTRRLFPLIFRRRDVLIDDRLRAIAEVAELRFPQNQRVPIDNRIAIFKTQHAFFGKRTVENIEARARFRLRTQLRERRPALAGLRIVQNSVTLAESAAT